MKISVVIPSYCAEEHLEQSLNSIASQQAEDIEVIVVDCSPHDKVQAICDKYADVRFIKAEKRFNPGEGRNIGAKASQGEYLVFIDSDVVLESNSLANIKQNIAAGYKVFGAALELNTKVNADFAARVEHYYFNHESQSSRAIKRRANLSSAFMIIEKELFLQFGGFSDIPRMQDTELTERIVASGQEIYFLPNVIGYQIQDSPLKKVLKKISITGNNIYFIRYATNNSFWFKLMFVFALPLLMFAKITRINIRNIRYSFSLPMLFIYAPFMYVCGCSWMYGLFKALLINKGIDSGR